MEPSLFTKIINGEIPCHKIFEDDRVFAFLDIHPEEEGHTLLVPKTQVDKIYDLSDEEYTYLWLSAKRIAKEYEAKTGKRTTFHVVGVDVPHAHIHIIPYDPANHKNDPRDNSEPDHTALAKIAEQLALQ